LYGGFGEAEHVTGTSLNSKKACEAQRKGFYFLVKIRFRDMQGKIVEKV